jgi:hypothetical protein
LRESEAQIAREQVRFANAFIASQDKNAYRKLIQTEELLRKGWTLSRGVGDPVGRGFSKQVMEPVQEMDQSKSTFVMKV